MFLACPITLSAVSVSALAVGHGQRAAGATGADISNDAEEEGAGAFGGYTGVSKRPHDVEGGGHDRKAKEGRVFGQGAHMLLVTCRLGSKR